MANHEIERARLRVNRPSHRFSRRTAIRISSASMLGAALAMSGTGRFRSASAQDRLSIATGGTGGVYFPYGGGMASILSGELDGVSVTAEVTSASVDNMLLIDSGDVDLAFTLGDTAFDAVSGNEPFPYEIAARTLATLYNNYTHIVTTTDAEIASVADLAGKRVSVGSPGSGTEVIANRILAAAGLDPDSDIEREALGAAESASAIQDRRIDAYFWSGGLPTASVTSLGATPNINLQLVPNGELASILQDEFGPFYSSATVPGETYPGQDEDVDVIIVPNLLVVNESFDEQLAFDILTVLFDNQEQLILSHPEAGNLTLENATQNSPLLYHPGAERYYMEQGAEIAQPATPVPEV